ncbi:MAG: CPBP family intramembrane metalloprotease [Melioribacteraceae bacterium]|nr:CPBP family intramembrane metalloprotease [Melioribacteraceae bacterium]MCF8355800.1 CPBP family intramembrane metalloprotease [Melioribacteraceae bacterium]MCF8392810.1 CPBP family intramembrane metalloprotease [Melioribacteraceae bacterium]MCF8418704.1 CPBP family intramembrane metalloprotease [Melioribacteraceae bacterium]
MFIDNSDSNHNEPQDDNSGNKPQLDPIMSPVAAAFLGLVGVFLLYQIVGSLITLAIFGLDLENANINAMRLMTIGGQVLLILLPALVLSKMVYEDVSTVIRFKFPKLKEVGVFVLGLIILTPLLQNYLYLQNYLVDQMIQSSDILQQFKEILDELDKLLEETYGNLLRADSIFEGSFIIVVVAVTPAICEEVFFRGYVQKSFELRMKPYMSAFITAIFFGLYHFNPYGLPALIFLGFYFGIAAYLSNSIFIPILLHFLNNLFAVVTYFIFGGEDYLETTSIPQDSIGSSVISFFILLIIFVSFLLFIIRNYKTKIAN